MCCSISGNAAVPISANVVGVGPPDDGRVVFLATTLPGGPTSPTVDQNIAFLRMTWPSVLRIRR